ncbi:MULTISPECIES: helix-turn-helix domain-containing protein [Flavobacterium]|uniref:HTH-type transcriptional activator RhaR n=1 Tax=Flavobacterium chungangense TaxID=554283 RepID=A0A6V6YZ94_9FLAO|nr:MULTISPECIES: helix-turn-helix domain-containing protein [Flavobacterium]CAD0004811.1 HTH-type transcriptional activator RhaR [Flavobacterium chungangense]
MASIKSIYNRLGIQIYIFEAITSRIVLREILTVDRFTVLMINSGAVCMHVNSRKIHLFVNEVIVIPKRSLCEILIITNPFKISLLSFTSEFAFHNSTRWPHVGYFEFFVAKDATKIFLKDKEIGLLVDLLKIINSKVSRSNKHIFKKELLLLSFNLFLYELARSYYRSAWYENVKHTGNEKIAIHFLRLLELNCRKEHSVKFYADALNVTTGHLTKTIKQVIEITAKQCIENAIILEAKILLQNNDLTILHISEELKFANTSFFSTFFKKHTSLSPSEYRLQLNSHK